MNLLSKGGRSHLFWKWLGRSAPWLVGWLVGLLVDSLACPAGWLIFELACSNGLTALRCSVSWLVGWLFGLLIDWLASLARWLLYQLRCLDSLTA